MPTLSTLQTTYINELSSLRRTNYSTKGTVAVRQTPGNRTNTFVMFVPPAPAKALYTSAKLQFWATAAHPSRQYRVRMVTSKWDVGRINWNNQPSSDSTNTGAATVTTAVAKNGMLEFDVTDMMNRVANGTPWFGFVFYLVSTDTSPRYFYSMKGAAVYRPRLVYEFTTAPRQPVNLTPSEGRAVSKSHPTLAADFIDFTGATNLTGLEVNIYSTASATIPVWSSGAVDTSEPMLDLSETDYSGINSGQTRWWDIRYRDGDDQWSPVSARASFTRAAKGTVTIVNPGPDPNNYVEEPTPPIIFEVSGTTQRNFQVVVLNANKTAKIFDSGKLTSDEGSVTVSDRTPLAPGRGYVAQVMVWDTVERATTPGDPAYIIDEREFVFQPTAGVSPVTSLEVSSVGRTPGNLLVFTTPTAPDLFDVYRDGTLTASLEPEDVFVSGSTYTWIDMLGAPNTPLKYEVRRRVNGRSSTSNPSVTHTNRPITAFLSTIDGEIVIPLLNYSEGLSQDDGSTTVQVLNSSEAFTVYQGIAARQGSFEGVLSGAVPDPDGNSMGARDYLNQFLSLDEPQNQGRPCVLTYADQSLPCVVSKLDYNPTVYNEEIVYVATFYVVVRRGVRQ